MKLEEKKRAIECRRRGLTYEEIRDELCVSKSSLSYWLRDIPLTEEQTQRIHFKNTAIKAKFYEYNKAKKDNSLLAKKEIVKSARREIGGISLRELKLIGTALYWAEGTKSGKGNLVIFSNSDPRMISLMMRWFREICEVPEEKFRLKVHAYDSNAISDCKKFWANVTNLPFEQFEKPYFKVSGNSNLKRGNTLPHGTLHIRICDTTLFHKICGWIEGLYYGPIV